MTPDLDEIEFEDAPPAASVPGRNGLVYVALALPILGGLLSPLVTSNTAGLILGGGIVLLTAALLAVDANRWGNFDRNGKERMSAATIFVGACLFWIVFYPLAFFRRRHFRGPNLGYLSLGVAVFFPAVPWVYAALINSRVPACDSGDVVQLVKQLVDSSSGGAVFQSIDGFHEVEYDSKAERRHGQCVVHTPGEDLTVDYFVDWIDRPNHRFGARLNPPFVPLCTTPEVVQSLEQVIRLTPRGAKAKSIDGNRQVRFDQKNHRRFGRCVAHVDGRDVVFNYFVEWIDRDKHRYQVREILDELPECTSPEVVRLAEKAFRGSPDGAKAKSITGYRDIRYDKKKETRFGQCIASIDGKETVVRFVVQWTNREIGEFLVQILSGRLPACNDPEVVRLVDRGIYGTPRGSKAKTIGRHRETRFDSKGDRRFGECVALIDGKEAVVRYLLQWEDADKIFYQVLLLPDELPSCTSADVVQLLERVIRGTPLVAKAKNINHHREIRFDSKADRRFGECVATIDGKETVIKYVVEWIDRESARYQVRLDQ
jgi:hypothetical protein